MQLTMRSMSGGVLSERDRLWEYSVAEFYQDLSLFLQEVEQRNKEIEKMKQK